MDKMKILVPGAGPIIIGQAAEFDYSGSQCCSALREAGHKVVLVNSNICCRDIFLVCNFPPTYCFRRGRNG